MSYFQEEYRRLQFAGGCIEGPVCGACGARYLDHPDEFIFNGTHGKLAAGGNRRKAKPSGFRIIHRPCKGKAGARISVSLDDEAQKELRDNVRILRCIVNGDSITTMRRVLADPDTGKQIGVSRLYIRIFWLEKTLLAFERAKLKEWKQREDASDRFSHMRIAHDDVTISVNWESRLDRRLTPLQFSVSADIRSGYVFRIDANFDPNVDPVEFIEEHYLDNTGQPTNLRHHYTQKSGITFTAPKMHFQRPSGAMSPSLHGGTTSIIRAITGLLSISTASSDSGATTALESGRWFSFLMWISNASCSREMILGGACGTSDSERYPLAIKIPDHASDSSSVLQSPKEKWMRRRSACIHSASRFSVRSAFVPVRS